MLLLFYFFTLSSMATLSRVQRAFSLEALQALNFTSLGSRSFEYATGFTCDLLLSFGSCQDLPLRLVLPVYPPQL